MQGQVKMEGLENLKQALIRGLPSFWRVFGGSTHFSASLPLISLVRNVSLMKPSLDSVCTGGGGGFTPWMNCQDMVEASTHGGADASLLSKQLDRVLSLVDSLRTAARVRLSAISSTEEALRNLGTFSFVALHF